MRILIINGPNLNLLGTREPQIYGNIPFEEYLSKMKDQFLFQIDYFQSNIEGEIINTIQQFDGDGIIINAGAYSHTSVAIHDSLKSIKIPCIEVHISNLSKRESFRHNSLITPCCIGMIMGFGLKSYELALEYFKKNN
ncbi:MAG: type II 3-dehydroquinate dehydratase [Flavobacteriia bacterium]|nr:type II 3-dehydroquinate dehydratase [Flavobacteriia bacterium]